MSEFPKAVLNTGHDDTWFETMPGEKMTVRISSRDTGGSMAAIEAMVPAGSGPPTHFHRDREELFQVLDGRFRFRCGEEEFEAATGALVVVPRGMPHAWINAGPSMGRIMFIFSPAGVEDFFPKIGITAPERWSEVAQEFDTFIIGPPMD